MNVRMLTPKWSETIMTDARAGPLCVVTRGARGWTGVLRLPASKPDGSVVQVTLSFDVQQGAPDATFDAAGGCQSIRCWGLARLGPGVWAVAPSLVELRYGLHAFVVLCDVPEPPPWEQADVD